MDPWKGLNGDNSGEHEEDLEWRTIETKEIEVVELGEEKDESHGLQVCILLIQGTELEMQRMEFWEITTREEFLDI